MKYLVLLGLLVGCGLSGPKFKAGDCVTIWDVPEFPEAGLPLSYSKILKVGKRNYLLETHTIISTGFYLEEKYHRMIDRSYELVNCEILGL